MTSEELKARVFELEIELQLADRAITTAIACLAVHDSPDVALKILRRYGFRELARLNQEFGGYDDE